jgi:hypothetical protein
MTTTSPSCTVPLASSATALSLAGRLVEALSTRSFDVLESCLATEVQLRALVPPGPFELTGAPDVAARFRRWFGDEQEYALVDASIGDVGPRTYARWRIRVAGPLVVEQHAFLTCSDKVERIDLLCSGFVTA